IGKAHRLGLKSRPSPVKANEAKAAVRETETEPKAAAAKPRPKPAPPEPVQPTPRAASTPPPAPAVPSQPLPNPAANMPRVVSVGPGGFLRQGPGDQQAPIPPAPPRRLVPAKPSPDIADKTSLLDLSDRVCRWPMGHPGEA